MPVARTRRVYESPNQDDGMRVLIDRLWPRGLSKDKAQIDLWLKQIAPSPELRKRFHAAPEDWAGFRKDYLVEVKDSPALAELRTLAKRQRVTLVYGWHDTEHNHAVILADLLRKR